jgi:predicted RND superfamily exporter protein
MLFIGPVNLVLNTESVFDDPAVKRMEEERIGDYNQKGQLIIKITHDDGRSITSDFSLVQKLMQLETELLDGSNSNTSWDSEEVVVAKLQTPFSAWSDAFESRNRSLENATKWADVLQPPIEGGWCGNQSNSMESSAFETTLLLLPKDTNFGVACPSFPGANEQQAPNSDEILWLIWLENTDDEGPTNWNSLTLWAEKISDSTEFEVDAVGVNMLFQKAKVVAEDDLTSILIPSVLFLSLVMYLVIRDWKISMITLGSVGLIITAEAGLISALGFDISIIDAIAFPIILAVAVDGAFWYCKSSRSKDEVRSILLIALVTTLAAVSLSLFSPIKAQRSLGLVMMIGIFLDWLFTRFVLEDFYLSRRNSSHEHDERIMFSPENKIGILSWPICLVMLIAIALASPQGVEVFDINQFLPEDDPALDEFEELKEKYLIASSTIAWIIIDVEGDSTEDYNRVLEFQTQLGHHPSVISFETGLIESPLVMGISIDNDKQASPTVNSVAMNGKGTPIMKDHRLQDGGITTGVAIAVFIDGGNAEAALQFFDDVAELMENKDLSGEIGGELVVGASLAKDFEDTRISQIIAAGFAVFIVAAMVTNSPKKAIRIAIGTIAIGLAVDGLASVIGERGVSTAPAVLLGMGFAADYLAHASSGHKVTFSDNFARWGAAITSVSVFLMLSFAEFPPAKQTGILLSISIIISVLLATSLSMMPLEVKKYDSEE